MSVDIIKIMEEIRSEIDEKDLKSSILPFSEAVSDTLSEDVGQPFDSDALRQRISSMQAVSQIVAAPPTGKNPLFTVLKKIVRKLTDFQVKPIIDAQNQYNAENLKALDSIEKYIEKGNEYNLEELYKNLCLMELKLKNAYME